MSRKLNCVIVEDEPIARKILEEYIGDVDFLDLTGKFENPVKAASMLSETCVDIIFLDINMPKLNGIEFLKISKNLPAVIVTTAYPEYALEGFALDVIDYLLKPVSFERFLKACNKARDYFDLKIKANETEKNKADHFFIKYENSIEKIFYHDLLYIEGFLNYVVLYTVSGKMMIYMTIKSMLEQLPPELFIKVHKSYIVNIAKIKGIAGSTVKIGNSNIAISQNLKDEVIKKILKDKLIKR
jgi:DNA-binding LytR/AlgR family response regulator